MIRLLRGRLEGFTFDRLFLASWVLWGEGGRDVARRGAFNGLIGLLGQCRLSAAPAGHRGLRAK